MKKSSKIRNKFDVNDISKKLGITYISVCRLLRAGKIKGHKLGQKWYVNKRDLNEYLNTGNIFDKPEKVILSVIEQGIKESQEENIKRLTEKVKELMGKEFDEKIEQVISRKIEQNFKKIDKQNVVLTGVTPERDLDSRRYKTSKSKEEYSKVKKL